MSDLRVQLRQPRKPRAIYGRDSERAQLQALVDDAIAGRGSLVLISGEAGIGKTTLVDDLVYQAMLHGCAVLTGACYDLTTNLPYGPWRELIRDAHRAGLPSSSDLEWHSAAVSADAMVAGLRDHLEALVEHGPLVLVLEDLHWSDAESLEFLRIFGRRVPTLPLLLIGTYREDEVTLGHPLYQLLPYLVRESDAQRLNLLPLDRRSIRLAIEHRYDLSSQDQDRLTEYLGERSGGVPFYLLELLRTLEEQQHLLKSQDAWKLNELELRQVPLLVRQLIEGRLARMAADSRRLLELASVIGLDVPVLLWKEVAATSDETFGDAVEQALGAKVLDETPPGTHLHFTHALVRDSLYEGIPLLRRQDWHRRVAEALAEDDRSEPDTVAHHFRKALDSRAVEWFIRAGSRAERVAWVTAAGHFEAALEMMGSGKANLSERGWLHLRRAKLLRGAQPRTSLAILDTATTLAQEADDDLLLTYVTYFRGQFRCLAGELQAGMADLELAVAALSSLDPGGLQRVEELEHQGVVANRSEIEGLLAALLATVGRLDEGLERAAAIIERADDLPTRAWWARAIALALSGHVNEAHAAFATCREMLLRSFDDASVAIVMLYQASNSQLPYRADDLPERRRFTHEAEAAWQKSGSTHGDVSPRMASLPFLLVEGDWEAARELGLSGIQLTDTTSEKYLTSTVVLAQLARAQGEASLAWKAIHGLLPGGPHTIPGHLDLAPSLTLVRVAAGLCLEREDLIAARAWIDMHERWLSWSGAVLGQADGQLLWAQYSRATGDSRQAQHYGERAQALAAAPRQPLTLLAAHRFLGEERTGRGQFAEARDHLEAALTLADACAAPYERALTLLASAELDRRVGAISASRAAIDEARDIFAGLGAAPALAHTTVLEDRLVEQETAMERTAAAGLSPREIEVLRLVATGRRNREIAEALFLSVRTVERHLTNLYSKIGAEGRAEAIVFAHDHDLI